MGSGWPSPKEMAMKKKVGPAYQGYWSGTSEEEVRLRFEEKYGRAPAEVIRSGGAVVAGPIRGEAECRRQETSDGS